MPQLCFEILYIDFCVCTRKAGEGKTATLSDFHALLYLYNVEYYCMHLESTRGETKRENNNAILMFSFFPSSPSSARGEK